MPKEIALVVGSIFFTANIILLVIDIYELHCDIKLLKTGNEIMGIITKVVTYPEYDNLQSGQYRFIAEFKIDNQTYYSISRFISTSKEKYMNKEVVIVYDKNNPLNARFKYDKNLKGSSIMHAVFLIISIGLVIYGIY